MKMAMGSGILVIMIFIVSEIQCLFVMKSETSSKSKNIVLERNQNYGFDEAKNLTQEEIRKVSLEWVSTIFSPNRY